jgi:OFA family oxalate/formate antiporter-like MFS transporter
MEAQTKRTETLTQERKYSLVNFGVQGWIVIIYCLLMFWLYVGMANDGSNITAPAIAERLGVNKGIVLNGNSIAGIVAVILFLIIGQINRKIGPRLTSGIFTIVAGICYFIVGGAGSIVSYTIAMSVLVGSIMSAGYIAGGTLVATWFPKRKGVVMGYTTMGHNLATAFYVPLIALLVGKFGITTGVVPISAICLVVGILGLLMIRDTPQERGKNPDIVSDEVYATEYDTKDEGEDGGWTIKKILSKRELWLVGISTGFFQICSVGTMTQLVSRNIELGFRESTAIMIMTLLACVGVFGSWLVGAIDERLGTKRTMIVFGFWYMTALLLNFTEVMPFVYVSMFMIAIGIGGSANFMTSLPTSVFGRQGFAKINSVLFPIQGIITALCFAVNGFVTLIAGELSYSYLIFAGVALVNVFIVSRIKDRKYNRDYHPDLEI